MNHVTLNLLHPLSLLSSPFSCPGLNNTEVDFSQCHVVLHHFFSWHFPNLSWVYSLNVHWWLNMYSFSFLDISFSEFLTVSSLVLILLCKSPQINLFFCRYWELNWGFYVCPAGTVLLSPASTKASVWTLTEQWQRDKKNQDGHLTLRPLIKDHKITGEKILSFAHICVLFLYLAKNSFVQNTWFTLCIQCSF